VDGWRVVAWRGGIVGVPSVALFWAYLGLAGMTGSKVPYVLGAIPAALIALAGVSLAERVGLAQPRLVGLGTPAVVAVAALVGTLTGGGLNDAGGGWRETLGWALVALLAYPAVAVVSEVHRTRDRILTVLAFAAVYALMIGYIQYSLPGWRGTYYRRYAVPMVAVDVPGFELTSARAYPSMLVVWLRGRPGQWYAGRYLRAEVQAGSGHKPPCADPREITSTRYVCAPDLIFGIDQHHWFRLAEPNGATVFKEVLDKIAKDSGMRPLTLRELTRLPVATY